MVQQEWINILPYFVGKIIFILGKPFRMMNMSGAERKIAVIPPSGPLQFHTADLVPGLSPNLLYATHYPLPTTHYQGPARSRNILETRKTLSISTMNYLPLNTWSIPRSELGIASITLRCFFFLKPVFWSISDKILNLKEISNDNFVLFLAPKVVIVQLKIKNKNKNL